MIKVIAITIILLMSSLHGQAQKSGTIEIVKPDKLEGYVHAFIAGKSGGDISFGELMKADKIEVNDSVSVIGFNYTSDRMNRRFKHNLLSDKIKFYFERLKTGEVVQFNNILCKDKNGVQFMAYDIHFKIID